MTLLLRKSSARARIEGWDPRIWGDDDYAVVDDTKVGRIYRELNSRGTQVEVVTTTDIGGAAGRTGAAAEPRNF